MIKGAETSVVSPWSQTASSFQKRAISSHFSWFKTLIEVLVVIAVWYNLSRPLQGVKNDADSWE
jgi:hypothetical protein